jgi:ABC-type sugar transport system permease subunit
MFQALSRRQYLLFILPAILIVFTLTAFPALYGVAISMTNMNFAYADWRFVGFENYARFFSSRSLGLIAWNTFVFVSAVVALQVTLGLGIAILLNKAFVGRRFVRSTVILPWIIPAIIIALMFQQMFSGSRMGVMNYFLSHFGFEAQSWLSEPNQAMWVMIAALVWRGIPLSIILQLGGLQAIDRGLYEAAEIDGATGWQKLRYITLPGLKPILLINLIMATSGSLNHVDIPLSLTGGGPGQATEVISLSIYKNAFEALNTSYAATIATVVLLLNLVLTILYLRILRRREDANV